MIVLTNYLTLIPGIRSNTKVVAHFSGMRNILSGMDFAEPVPRIPESDQLGNDYELLRLFEPNPDSTRRKKKQRKREILQGVLRQLLLEFHWEIQQDFRREFSAGAPLWILPQVSSGISLRVHVIISEEVPPRISQEAPPRVSLEDPTRFFPKSSQKFLYVFQRHFLREFHRLFHWEIYRESFQKLLEVPQKISC